jgi:hypothetical protein
VYSLHYGAGVPHEVFCDAALQLRCIVLKNLLL